MLQERALPTDNPSDSAKTPFPVGRGLVIDATYCLDELVIEVSHRHCYTELLGSINTFPDAVLGLRHPPVCTTRDGDGGGVFPLELISMLRLDVGQA